MGTKGGIFLVLLGCALGFGAPRKAATPCAPLTLLSRAPRDSYDKERVLQIFHYLKKQKIKITHANLHGNHPVVLEAIRKFTKNNLSGSTLHHAASHLFGFDNARRLVGLDPKEEDAGYSTKKLVRILKRISEELHLPVNHRTLKAGFDSIKRIILEEADIDSDGEKLLSYLQNKVGLASTFKKAGLDYKQELRSYLNKKDIAPLLQELHKRNVELSEKNIVLGHPEIDRLIKEHAGANLGSAELWLIIKDSYPGMSRAKAIKTALIDAGIDPKNHGLGQTENEFRKERAETSAERFRGREASAMAILSSLHNDKVKILRSELMANPEKLEAKIKEHSKEKWNAEQFFNWVFKEYPGGFTALRKKANVPIEQEPREARNHNGIEQHHILSIFELMHQAKIKVNRENLLKGSPEIDLITETVLGYHVPSHIVFETARTRFGENGTRKNGFENAQLAARLDPKKENFSSRYNRLKVSEEEFLVKAMKSLEGKRPLDYESMLNDDSSETAELIFKATGMRMLGKTLMSRIRKHSFGGWYKFMEEKAKIDPAQHRSTKGQWTPEKTSAALYWLDYFGWPVNSKALLVAEKRPYKEIIKFATGDDLSPTSLLQSAVKNPKGGLRASLKDAKLDYRHIYEVRNWDDGDLLRVLRLFYDNSIPINSTYMRDNPPARVEELVETIVGKDFKGNKSGLAVLNMAAKRFEGLDNALWAININPMEERLRMYSYKVVRDRTLDKLFRNNNSVPLREYFEKMIDLVEEMTPKHRAAGFLVLDLVIDKPELMGKPEMIADRIYFETGKSIAPRTIKNFLEKLAKNPGYEHWRAED
jgi:hypothetical protein